MKKIITCVGTRPNFIKITQLHKYFAKYPSIQHKILHTGQHFDQNMKIPALTGQKLDKI